MSALTPEQKGTSMTEEQLLRLECVRIAQENAMPGGCASDLVADAGAIFSFVAGSSTEREGPDAN